MFIDLDGFKPINDSLGHAIGDKVLKEVVKRIRHYTLSEDAFLRIGGDEFLLILNHLQSEEELENRLQQILESVSQMLEIEGNEINLTLSIGVACCPKDGVTVESLMDASDNAMYKAKREGRNRFIFA